MNPENLTPFQPGESGNPAGRPPGSRNLSTILKEMLDTDVEVNGEKVKFKDAIIQKLISKAHKGDMKAIQEIFDRTEGKAKQEIKHDLPESIVSVSIKKAPDDVD